MLRADTFLERGGNGRDADLIATLAPFDSLAAFIINTDLNVVACNEGAIKAFEIQDGAHLGSFKLSEEAQLILSEGLDAVFKEDGTPLRLLQVDSPTKTGPALFQIRKINVADQHGPGVALVITTQCHWQEIIGQILKEIFKLTLAEQGVVRGLVEGLSASAIAAERGTGEGTVRGQIKSVMAKMNARSQSEVIRLVLSLRDISKGSQEMRSLQHPLPARVSEGWIQAEVWKPFKTLILPDGRKMDYHDMGPVTGRPVLCSHMGYCLARWHAPMIMLAYRHSLRVICPIRPGYGLSDNIDPKASVLDAVRADTRYLLENLGIERLPYLAQGNEVPQVS